MVSTRAWTPAQPAQDTLRRRSVPIGAAANCLDGSGGQVAGVLRDAHGALTHLVVRQGPFRRYVLVPGKYIGAIGDSVELDLRRAELDGFPEHRDSTETKADVERALRSIELFHDRDDFVAVRVNVINGVVELRGYVRSEARRHEATAIAARIRGVLDVRNHLHSDEAITRHVHGLLRSDPQLRSKDIRAASRFGIVDLFGLVDTRAERAAAAVLARQVPGIAAINNLLRVAA